MGQNFSQTCCIKSADQMSRGAEQNDAKRRRQAPKALSKKEKMRIRALFDNNKKMMAETIDKENPYEEGQII